MLVWSAHRTKVRCLAFSPDGRRLASAAERIVAVKLWDPGTGAAAGELRGRWGFTSGAAFSPNGRRIATMSSDVVIWDADTRQPLARASGPRVYYGPAYSPDGGCVAAVGWGRVCVWDVPTVFRHVRGDWTPARTYESAARDARFNSVAFDPTGAWVAANGAGCAVVWDRATGAERHTLRHPNTDALSVVAFSPDGSRVAFTHSKVAEVHALDGGSDPLVLAGHSLFVRAIGFTPDGGTVMTAASDGTVRFWDAATGAPGRVLDWGIGRVYSAAFSPDGLTCAAGGEKGQIVVWDVDG